MCVCVKSMRAWLTVSQLVSTVYDYIEMQLCQTKWLCVSLCPEWTASIVGT